MKVCLALIAISFLSLAQSLARKPPYFACFQCEGFGEENNVCAEAQEFRDVDMGRTNLRGSWRRCPSNRCLFTYSKYKKPSKNSRATRQCLPEEALATHPVGCVNRTYDEYEDIKCYCDTSFCNDQKLW